MLKKLIDGNKRYLEKPKQKDFKKSRQKTQGGQKPHSIILTCSDSRVPPEYIFDADIGELFVIRTAGNVIDKVVLGSIEYAAKHLNASLLVVLGHSGCGAVSAALSGESDSKNISAVLEKIKPAIEAVPNKNSEEVVNANIKLQIKNILRQSQICEKFVKEGKLKIIGAKYNLLSGKVDV